MKRYFQAGKYMMVVDSVAYGLLGRSGAQEYVKVEDYAAMALQCDYLQKQVDYRDGELRAQQWGLLAVTAVMLVSMGWIAYQLWEGCRV